MRILCLSETHMGRDPTWEIQVLLGLDARRKSQKGKFDIRRSIQHNLHFVAVQILAAHLV
jgi:hypothetical protein